MKNLWTLLCLFAQTSSPLRQSSRTSGAKQKRTKTAVYTALFLYVILFFGYTLTRTFITLYAFCKPFSAQNLVPFFTACAATVVSVFSSFYAVSGSYGNSRIQETLLSLPIRKREFFYARFLCLYAEQLIVCALIMAAGCGVFAYFENRAANPSFYFKTAAGTLILPLFPLLASYALTAPFLRGENAAKRLRILATGGTLALILLFSVSAVYFQSADFESLRGNAAAQRLRTLRAAEQTLSRLYPPVHLASGLIASPRASFAQLFGLLGFAGLAAALSVLLAKPYMGALCALCQTPPSRQDAAALRREFEKPDRSYSLFALFLRRDIAAVFREPAFLTSGPLSVVLLPALAIFMLRVNPSALNELLSLLSEHRSPASAFCIAAAFSGALASASGGIGATAFSREGKSLFMLLTLPVHPKTLLRAKFAHTMLYSFVCALFSGVLTSAFPGLTTSETAVTFFLSFALSCFLHLCAFSIDASRPYTSWQRPSEAVKRNLNTVIAFFVQTFAFVSLLSLCLLFINSASGLFTAAAVISLAAAFGWICLERRAGRSFNRLFFMI